MHNRTVLVLWLSLVVAGGVGLSQNKDIRAGNGVATPNGTAAKSSSADVRPKSSPVVDSDYIIGPDDVLAINVWKESDLSRSAPVRPDGKITLPLLGDVDANGTTPAQLQTKIEKGLADYLSKPAVTVIVQEPRSHKFNVIGEVQRPGAYVLTGPMTVLDAISLAGGFREWAKTKKVYVLRAGPTGQEKIPVNYNQVVKGEKPDTQLKARDTVVVP